MLTSSGCATAASKQRKAISQGVYATKASIAAGRFDLAKQYNDEVARIVAPPSKPIVVQSVKTDAQKATKNSPATTSQQYVVMPPDLIGLPTVVVGSQQWNDLLNNNKTLQAQVVKEHDNLKEYHNTVDKSLQATADELAKEKKKSWWGWLISGLGITGILGIVALCIFFPAAIPVVLEVVEFVISLGNKILTQIGKALSKKKVTPTIEPATTVTPTEPKT